MLCGMFLGVIAGAIINYSEGSAEFIKPFGDLFITLIKMVVTPLVFATLVAGAANISNTAKLGRIAVKTIIYYCVTSVIAMILGLCAANLFNLSSGLDYLLLQNASAQTNSAGMRTVLDAVLSIVPSNPFDAFAKGNILQIIFFSILLGFTISLCGDKAKPLAVLFDALSEAMIKMTLIIMRYCPIGTFALMTYTIGSHGLEALLPLLKVILLMYAVSLLHALLIYASIIHLCGIKIKNFLSAVSAPLMIAFTTCSSAAALSSNLIAVEKLGVPRTISSFSIPLGNTINMDGAAIYLGIVIVFSAQLFNIDLTLFDYIQALILGLLASIGSMGMPGAILIMMSAMFMQLGLPAETIALMAGIDRIMDMARTPMNILGDAVGACLVSKSE